MSEESTMKLTDFDYLTGDHHLQMVKAALPYINIPEQRFLSILVKFQELRRTIALFSDEEASAVGIMSLDDTQSRSPFDMMNAIKPYADPQEQDFIDMICNFIQGWRIGSQYQQDIMAQETEGQARRQREHAAFSDEIPRSVSNTASEAESPSASGRSALEQIKNLLPPEQQARFETASLLWQTMRQMA